MALQRLGSQRAECLFCLLDNTPGVSGLAIEGIVAVGKLKEAKPHGPKQGWSGLARG